MYWRKGWPHSDCLLVCLASLCSTSPPADFLPCFDFCVNSNRSTIWKQGPLKVCKNTQLRSFNCYCLPYSSFRTEFIEGFVKWLDLPDAVLPAMTAFASGLGGEGTETFAQILLKDPILKENPVVITQVSSYAPLALVCFCKRDLSYTSVCNWSSVCTGREANQYFWYAYTSEQLCGFLAVSLSINSSWKWWTRGTLLSVEWTFCVFDAFALQSRTVKLFTFTVLLQWFWFVCAFCRFWWNTERDRPDFHLFQSPLSIPVTQNTSRYVLQIA